MKTGLLLLSGGAGRRMGSPKHALGHPAGGSWGGHLVRVFESVFPGGPILVLGEPLPDRPELQALEDPREGPAMALRQFDRFQNDAPFRAQLLLDAQTFVTSKYPPPVPLVAPVPAPPPIYNGF